LDSFENFLEDMGESPDGMTLDRINGDGDYEPSNCRWATMTEQNRNRRDNRMVIFNGETMCVAAMVEKSGINRGTIRYRLDHGLNLVTGERQ